MEAIIDKQDIIYLLKGIEVPYELLSKMPNDIGYIGSCGHNDPCWCWKRDVDSYSNYSEEQLFDLYLTIKRWKTTLKENNMTYEVKRNGQKVKGRIVYTNKNLLFESGTEIYESVGVKVEANFSNRPTTFCIVVSLILLLLVSFMLS